MIAYFDTSAIVPLLVEEVGSSRAALLWDEADRVLSNRLVYAEARAALAAASRAHRIDPEDLGDLVQGLERLYRQVDFVELSDDLVHRAGALAEAHALRGYDAVHLASAEMLADEAVVFVAGDGPLCRAAARLGLSLGCI